ncbi:MAG: penicillin-binding protein [Rhodospirillaceae bacterium]|nr:penicillin-binding protein [Rhodospirillaceae bacterium]
MRWILYLSSFFVLVGIAGTGIVAWGLYAFGKGLPDYKQLADYQPPVVTRVHAGDGRLLAEYATERRVFVPVDAIPKRVIKAFLSAEDKNFYTHYGVDFVSLAGALVENLRNLGKNRRPRGASTITQQVAKNFLLTNEVSIERKVKEAILAFRIERALSKNRILELYLNEIYLGFGSYGVAAAALNYFNKSLDDLTIPEAAFLAALPKAPNNYHPIRRRKAALARRNWVIKQMNQNGFISRATVNESQRAPLEVKKRSATEFVEAAYFTEEVRRELMEQFGESGVYGGGLSVRTTVDPHLQRIADETLREGLMLYDRRHGWRGPISHLPVVAGWGDRLKELERPKGILNGWRLALVLLVSEKMARIGFEDGSQGNLPISELRWAREWREQQRIGGTVNKVSDVVARGDVILVEPIAKMGPTEAHSPETFTLRQIPDVGGGIIALDPHSGRVLAMSGGWSYEMSEFNRATQALRQPGSAFKPFVYLAALDLGLTPATRILDAPFVIDQGPGLPRWKPANYTKEFYGPTSMRIGVEKSRNLMTVRLAQNIGMDRVIDYARRFGIADTMPPHLSMALGAGETTLIKLTSAYAMLVNGGKRITPSLIDRIQDRNGRTVFRHDKRVCVACLEIAWSRGSVPHIPDDREKVADQTSAYQMLRMLEGVVQRGTGRRIRELGKPLAGKTGTTNNNMDTWFIGFTPDLAVGAFVGFDKPRTLGHRDTGSNVAAPLFKMFMKRALENQPEIPFRAPPGILHVRIDAETGSLARPGDKNVILEAFKPGTDPKDPPMVIDGGYSVGWKPKVGEAAVAGSGRGLY